MGNEENVIKKTVEQPGEGPSEEHFNDADSKAEVIEQMECQVRLAVQRFGGGKTLQQLTAEERNNVLMQWSDSDYSEAFRAVIEDLRAKCKPGEHVNYEKITFDDILAKEAELKESGKFRRNI
jgi:hypothetical protein